MKSKEEGPYFQPLIRPDEDAVGSLAQSFEQMQVRFLTFVRAQEVTLDPAINDRFNAQIKDIQWEVLLFKKKLHDLFLKHGIEPRTESNRRAGLEDRRTR